MPRAKRAKRISGTPHNTDVIFWRCPCGRLNHATIAVRCEGCGQFHASVREASELREANAAREAADATRALVDSLCRTKGIRRRERRYRQRLESRAMQHVLAGVV